MKTQVCSVNAWNLWWLKGYVMLTGFWFQEQRPFCEFKVSDKYKHIVLLLMSLLLQILYTVEYVSVISILTYFFIIIFVQMKFKNWNTVDVMVNNLCTAYLFCTVVLSQWARMHKYLDERKKMNVQKFAANLSLNHVTSVASI